MVPTEGLGRKFLWKRILYYPSSFLSDPFSGSAWIWPDLIPPTSEACQLGCDELSASAQLSQLGSIGRSANAPLKIGQHWLRSGPECLWSGTPVGNGLSTDSRHGAPQLSASHWAPLGSDQLALGWWVKKGGYAEHSRWDHRNPWCGIRFLLVI